MELRINRVQINRSRPVMRICKYTLLQIRIIANTHYCDPDSSGS